MRKAVASLALIVGACGPGNGERVVEADGERLERAAIQRGLVADTESLDPIGAYTSGEDRVCITSGIDGLRIGIVVDLDEAQKCTARGTVEGREELAIALGDACRFSARFDGERLVFPAVLPTACDRGCTGRASLSALAVERLSNGKAEARAMRDLSDQPLCG